MKPLVIANKIFNSRLFVGTGKFGNHQQMRQAIIESGTEMVTVALKRIDLNDTDDDLLAYIPQEKLQLLPNTSGARTASEAILVAQLAREAFNTSWVKLEIHPDPKYLMPDGEETLKAAATLVKKGFVVLPYVHADPVLCKKLEDVGVAAVMPLGSPIGSNLGIKSKEFIRIIIEQSNVPVIIDAGIGAPSHAAEAMEMGADAVLINTAIAIANNPVQMAIAFKLAVEAGRMAFETGLPSQSIYAEATSPIASLLE